MSDVTQDHLNELTWFHGIDFEGGGSGLQIKGRIGDDSPQNYSLFSIYPFLDHIEVQQTRVIDIGTMDGLMAFILKALGAGHVDATDLYDRDSFRLARKALGFQDEIEYHPKLDISHMAQRFGADTYDLVVFAGILYHLLSPLEGLLICRQLLRRNGLLLLETFYDQRSTEPVLRFNMSERNHPINESTTYFLPTLSALFAMLGTASFDPLAVFKLKGYSRVGVLAKAVRPSQVRGKTAVQRCHDIETIEPMHFAFGNLFYKLEHAQQTPSTIQYTGPDNLDGEIDIWTYRPRVPFQPQWPKSDGNKEG